MLGIVVFVSSFLLLFGVTIIVPVFPPAQILGSFLGFPEIVSPISGISGVALINGLVNGLVWATIIFFSYRLIVFSTRKKVGSSADFLDYKTGVVDTSDYVPPLTKVEKSFSSFRKKTGQAALDQGVEVICGIGSVYGEKLRSAGVWTVNDLLQAGRYSKDRYALAKEVGVQGVTVYSWVVQGDFLRVKGVGKQYASLLESAGVDTVADLSRRDPVRLYQQLIQTNRKMKVVKRAPTLTKVRGWIERSKRLEDFVY